jgi:hypothetical protein
MSLTDLMVVVAGCAVGYSLLPLSPGWVRRYDAYGTRSSEYDSLFWTFRKPLLILAFAMAAVIIGRQVRYRRMPRPAEWPALVLAVALLWTDVLDPAYPLAWAGLYVHLSWIDWHDSGLWPELILFGVPVIAGLRDCARSGRRQWTWTEWVGLVLGLILAACWLLDGFAPSAPTNPDRLADAVVRGLSLVVVGLAGWLMFHGCDAVRVRSRPGAYSQRS